MKPLFSILLVACASSCANMKMTQTGFLGDYESLEAAPQRQVWGVPDEIMLQRTLELDSAIAAGTLDAVVIDPVVYRPREDARYVLSDEAARKLEESSTKKLRQVFAKEFEVLNEPRAGAARIRLAITDVNPSKVWLNVLGVILIVPPDMGGACCEMEVVDAVDGSRLAAMTATREGTPFLLLECFSKHGHARHGVKKWAYDVSRLLRGE